MNNCGAIIQANFPIFGKVTTLGRAGVGRDGLLKSSACLSHENARERAIRVFFNKCRGHISLMLNQRWGEWTNYPELSKAVKVIEELVRAKIAWQLVDDNLSIALIDHGMIVDIIERMVA